MSRPFRSETSTRQTGLFLAPTPLVANPVGAADTASYGLGSLAGCLIYNVFDNQIQDGLAKIFPYPTNDPELQREIEKEANRREYKRRCTEPPPPGLARCRPTLHMPMILMDTRAISKEIETVFPAVPMPVRAGLSFHKAKTSCAGCQEVADDLERYRAEEIGAEGIRLLHQDLSHLSAKAWRWLLPHYLQFCLSDAASYSRVETEFLIYSLGPELRFQTDTLQRLSLFTASQLACLVHFVEWCSRHPYWSEYFPESIDKALSFLRTIVPSDGRKA